MLTYTTQMKKSLLNKLNEYRLEKGLSQRKTAKALGVDHVSLHRWLTGAIVPGDISVYRIQKFLKQKGVKV